MTYTPSKAIVLLIQSFPSLKAEIEEDDLLASPHLAYSLLAVKLLENPADLVLLSAVTRFANHLATSGDSLLEELLVVDILEGIAQDAGAARDLRSQGLGAEAAALLEAVERDFFGRT